MFQQKILLTLFYCNYDLGNSMASHKDARLGTEDCVFEFPWHLSVFVRCNGSSCGAVGIYSLLSSALARLVAFMRVWGRCWEAVYSRCTIWRPGSSG